MYILLTFLNGCWWGFLRRWYGGLFPDEQYKILGNRGLQTTIMLLSLFPIIYQQTVSLYSTYSQLFNIIYASLVTAWIHSNFGVEVTEVLSQTWEELLIRCFSDMIDGLNGH